MHADAELNLSKLIQCNCSTTKNHFLPKRSGPRPSPTQTPHEDHQMSWAAPSPAPGSCRVESRPNPSRAEPPAICWSEDNCGPHTDASRIPQRSTKYPLPYGAQVEGFFVERKIYNSDVASQYIDVFLLLMFHDTACARCYFSVHQCFFVVDVSAICIARLPDLHTDD